MRLDIVASNIPMWWMARQIAVLGSGTKADDELLLEH
jgi:hypothetical protein